MSDGVLTASATRRQDIDAWFATFRPGMTVALSTHINADRKRRWRVCWRSGGSVRAL